MTAAPSTPEGILDSMRTIVDYDWEVEKLDYEDEGKPAGHVFEHLQQLDTWLKGLGK